MSMLNIATTLSHGTVGFFVKWREPRVPSSSAAKAMKRTERGRVARLAAKSRAVSSSAATPEALSSAPWWICGPPAEARDVVPPRPRWS